MTNNQLQYQRNLIQEREATETERSNKTREAETNRANLAQESIQRTANQIKAQEVYVKAAELPAKYIKAMNIFG